MARWARSWLRGFGIGAVAVLGGALFFVPSGSSAAVVPSAAAAAADRIVTVAGQRGRSAFEFRPASGDRDVPFGFVSTGGTVQARQLGGVARPMARAATGAPVRSVQSAPAATTYKTTLTVDSENWSAWNSLINMWNRDTWSYVPVTEPQNSLSTSVNLPPGNYYVTAIYGIYGVNSYLLTTAFTVSNKAQTVHLSEKTAKEVALKVDDTTARREASAVWMSLPNGDLVGFAGGPRARTYVTTASIAGTTLRVHDLLTKAGSTGLRPSPYRYDLWKSWSHPLPASPVSTVKTASLARTTTTVKAQGITSDGAYETVPMTGEWTGVYLPTAVRAPATFTEYVTPGVTMARLVDYGNSQQLFLSDRSLPAGVSAGETAGAGPLVPNAWPSAGGYSERAGNVLHLGEYMALGDAAGNRGWDWDASSSTTLSSGGEVLGTTTGQTLSVTVPPAEQTYQLEQTMARKASWSQLSTSIRSEWTFVSSGPSTGKLPLIDLAAAASGLDQRNRAGAAPVQLTVTPSTRQVSATSAVDRIEWSADDGATWAQLPLTASGGGVQVSLAVPATAAFVSLRFTASNDRGGLLTRTVARALAGPATAGDESVGATTISNVKVNGGRTLVVGVPAWDSTPLTVTATFTASDPSGVASAGLFLWHGAVNAPDGLQRAYTSCTPSTATTSNCTATVYFWDPRYSLGGSVLAGLWRAEVWASAADGTGFTDRRAAGSLVLKRGTRLTTDATPEPVKKGKTITVTGVLTRADWDSWTVKAYASRTLTLQWAKAGTSKWVNVKTAKTDANGKLKTTVKATADGWFRWTFAGDATSNTATSAGDYVDVK